MKTVRLENWSVTAYDQDGYLAPELRTPRLAGTCYDHPDHADGTSIITSTIKAVNGRVVSTQNSRYVLGAIKPEYLKWLTDNGYHYDVYFPIRLKDQKAAS